jgi:hypothetical protein
MKKALLLFLYCLFFLVHSSYAQKIRFTDTSNKWTTISYYVAAGGPHFYYSKYYKDTLINNTTYLISDFGYVREDTILKKVYIKNGSYQQETDTNERVLYDYTVKIGDTLYSKYTVTDTIVSYVVKKDSTFIDGLKYYTWEVENFFHELSRNNYSITTYTYIEGIGSTTYPSSPLDPRHYGPVIFLKCFQNKGITPTVSPHVLSPYFYFDNSQSCKLSVPNTTSLNLAITIYPNPANESSIIKLPYKMQSGTLSIINAMGQVMMQKEIQYTEQIHLGSLPSGGLYFYRIIDKQNNQSFTGKFIYE